MSEEQETVRRLVAEHGRTFAQEAGVTLDDEPSPLWELLMLALLSSTRISADIAVATTGELIRAGWRTPQRLRASTWQQRVDALGRGGYRRYDESTATRLAVNAELLQERWGGDLRRLRDEADGDPAAMARALRGFDGIGRVGATIFLREVQAVWPQVRPFVDDMVVKGAGIAGLPGNAADLARLLGDDDLSCLSAALVRVARRPALMREG